MATPRASQPVADHIAGPSIPTPGDTQVTVTLDLVDMLSTGHSLRALARAATTPEGTKAIYWRTGTAMVNAAHAAIQKGSAK